MKAILNACTITVPKTSAQPWEWDSQKEYEIMNRYDYWHKVELMLEDY